jgi:hypothetical protein
MACFSIDNNYNKVANMEKPLTSVIIPAAEWDEG